MNLGLRGVMDADGDIHVWPTLLMDHNGAFRVLRLLSDYRVRFRQWGNEPGEPIDFDFGASYEDRMAVVNHVATIQKVPASDLAMASGVR